MKTLTANFTTEKNLLASSANPILLLEIQSGIEMNSDDLLIVPWSNVIACWPMNGNWNDIKSTYHGTRNGNLPHFSAKNKLGNLCGAFHHNSVNYISYPGTSGISVFGSYNRSISIWFKPASLSTPDYARVILGKRSDASATHWVLGIMNNNTIMFWNGNGGLIELSTTEAIINGWNHLVLSYTGATTKVLSCYLNGEAAGSGSLSAFTENTTANLSVGGWSSSQGDSFDGLIDETVLFNTALSSAQAIGLYNQQQNLYYSDRAVTVSGQSQTYSATVLNFGPIINQVSEGEESVKESATEIELDNADLIHNSITTGKTIEIYQWFTGLTASDKALMFSGKVSNDVLLQNGSIKFTAKDFGAFFNKRVGSPLTTTGASLSEMDSANSLWPFVISVWHMNNDWSDAKGGHTGSPVNATFLSNAGSFDGSNSYVNLGNHTDFWLFGGAGADRSISVWFKPDVNGSTYKFLMGRRVADTDSRWQILLWNDGKIRWQSGVGGIIIQSAATFSTSSWNHLVITYLNSTKALTMYLNGSQTATGSLSTFTEDTIDAFTFGGRTNSPPDRFDGLMDEVATFAKVLSSGEVSTLYSEQLVAFTTTGPLAFFPDADPDDVGKIKPIIYGQVLNSPCLAIESGAVTTLTHDQVAGTNVLYVTDTTRFPASGTLIVGDEEDIVYTGKATTAFTGCSNVSFAYPRSSKVLQKVSQLKYLVADHPVKAISNVRLLPTGMKVEDAVRIIDTDMTINTNDNGLATVSITNIAAVKKSVEIVITKQQVNASSEHGHTYNTSSGYYTRYLDQVEAPTGSPFSPTNLANAANGIFETTYACKVNGAYQNDYNNGTAIKIRRVASESGNESLVSIIPFFNLKGDEAGDYKLEFYWMGTLKAATTISVSTSSFTTYSLGTVGVSGGYTGCNHSGTYFRIKWLTNGYPDLFISEVWWQLNWSENASRIGSTTVSVDMIDAATVGGNSVADTLGGVLICDVDGWADNSVATYTESSSSLISSPEDIVHHAIVNYGNYATHQDIDLSGSFTFAKASFPSSYSFGFRIDNQIDSNVLCEQLAQQCYCRFRYGSDGLAKLIPIKDDGTESKTLDLSDEDTLKDSENNPNNVAVTIPGTNDVFNKYEIKYDLNYSLGGWGSADAYNGTTESSDSSSIIAYGERNKSLLFYAVRNASMAADLRDKYLARYKDPHATFSFKSWEKHIDLEPGDLITATYADLGINTGKTCEVLEVDYYPAIARDNKGIELQVKIWDTSVGFSAEKAVGGIGRVLSVSTLSADTLTKAYGPQEIDPDSGYPRIIHGSVTISNVNADTYTEAEGLPDFIYADATLMADEGTIF